MIWIQQPITPQDRWRLHIDAAYHHPTGVTVTGLSVFDEAGALIGSLTHVSEHMSTVPALAAWVSDRLAEVNDALTPTFPSASP